MIKSIFQSLLSKGAVAIINFLIFVVSSKYLGVSSRGEISIFILNIAIVQAVSGIYTGYSIVHFVPRFNSHKLVGGGILFTLVSAMFSNAAIVSLNKQVPGYEWFGWGVSVLVILNTFNCMVLLGQQRIKLFNQLSVLQPLILAAGIVFYTGVLKVYTFEAYLFPLLLSFLCAFVLSSAAVAKGLNTARQTDYKLREILTSGVIFQAGLLMFMFSNRLSYYFLPGKAAVGLFSSAATLMEAVLIVANGIAPVLLARVANQQSEASGLRLTLVLATISFLLSLCGVAIIFVLPESLFVAVLGNGFAGIRHLMLLYSPAVVCASVFIPVIAFYSGTGKQLVVLRAYCLGFAVTLLMLPMLVYPFGVNGAALLTDCAYLAISVYLVVALYRVSPPNSFRLATLRLGVEELQKTLGKE